MAPRYSLTFADLAAHAYGFLDCATPDDARAWLETMLAGNPGKATPPAPPKAAPRPAESTPAPAPAEPRGKGLAPRLLASLRMAGPCDVVALQKRFPHAGPSSVRGRLSELRAAGWVVLDGDVYRALPGTPAPAPPPPASVAPAEPGPLAARILATLARQPMRIGTLAQYTSCRVADLEPAVSALVASSQVVDRGGLFRLAPAPTPPAPAVKSRHGRAAPSPPPARQRKS